MWTWKGQKGIGMLLQNVDIVYLYMSFVKVVKQIWTCWSTLTSIHGTDPIITYMWIHSFNAYALIGILFLYTFISWKMFLFLASCMVIFGSCIAKKKRNKRIADLFVYDMISNSTAIEPLSRTVRYKLSRLPLIHILHWSLPI